MKKKLRPLKSDPHHLLFLLIDIETKHNNSPPLSFRACNFNKFNTEYLNQNICE